MKPISFIFVCFVIVQNIFIVDILCSSTEYVECDEIYDDYDSHYEGISKIMCFNDSQKIDFSKLTSDYLQCSNYDGYSVLKTKIIQVNFENCHMSRLTFNRDIFEVYKNLEELNISYIGLELLENKTFVKAGSLQRLNASHNNIREVPAQLFSNAVNLNEFDFSHNQIKQLDALALSGAKQLERVDFSYNKIGNISGLIFSDTLSLECLNLSHNEISAVKPKTFADLKELTILDLSFNNIKKLSENFFTDLNNLQSLRLDHLSNETIEIEPSTFVGLNSLEKLCLSQNHIASIGMGVFEGLQNLRELDLSRNRPVYSHLNSNESRVTILDKDAFDNLINLQRLNLANNPIEILNIGTFSKLKNLQYLNLSNTNLAEIRFGTFSHTRQLVSLDLSWNRLESLDFGLFLPRYAKLESLYLNENRLTEMNGYTYSLFPFIKVLGITGNNFNCSYLKKFLKKYSSTRLTYVNDYWEPLNHHETNIHGIECHQDEGNETKSTVIMIDTTGTTIKYDVNDDVKLKQENFTNLQTKQLITSLTEAFSAFSEGQNDLKSLLMFISFILSMLFIIVLIIVLINRDKILKSANYRVFYRNNAGHPRTGISNGFEISTFNQESNSVS